MEHLWWVLLFILISFIKRYQNREYIQSRLKTNKRGYKRISFWLKFPYLGKTDEALFKATVNLFSYEEKVTLFLRKNTRHTIPCKKNYFFLSMHFSFYSTTSVFISL